MIVRQGNQFTTGKGRYFQELKGDARCENRSPASDELAEMGFVLYGEYGVQLGLASI